MPRITTNEMIAGMVSYSGIQSATWRRKCDKYVPRCPSCNKEAARIRSDWVCKTQNCRYYDSEVTIWWDKVANKGDVVRLQFRVPLNGEGTKNWQPAGGFCFNAATRAEAERIKQEKRLLQVCKMSESGTNDMRATPRLIPVNEVDRWIVEGVEYEIV